MKKIALLLAVISSFGTAAMASNYPSDYMNQSAVAIAAGPAVLAEVSSAQSNYKYVIGYKKSGILAGKADHVDAYVKISYKLIPFNGGGGYVNSMTAERQIKLMPEWNGTGYISGELAQYSSYGTDGLLFLPSQALTYNRLEIEKIELAFNVNGQWDSNNSVNYYILTNTLYRAGERFRSGYASQAIAIDTWNFIVGMMRK